MLSNIAPNPDVFCMLLILIAKVFIHKGFTMVFTL